MPNNYEDWYESQVKNGLLPNENGYYCYVYNEEESKMTNDSKGESCQRTEVTIDACYTVREMEKQAWKNVYC